MANGNHIPNHNHSNGNGKGSASLRSEGNVLFLEGILDFDTVVPLLPELRQQLKLVASPVFDLQGVSYTNSAGVALLLEALRQGKEGQATFRSIPADMQRIIRMCGLQDVIVSE